MEFDIDLPLAKPVGTGLETAPGRDKFFLFEVTVMIWLVWVTVVAFAFKWQSVLATLEVPVDVGAIKGNCYFC